MRMRRSSKSSVWCRQFKKKIFACSYVYEGCVMSYVVWMFSLVGMYMREWECFICDWASRETHQENNNHRWKIKLTSYFSLHGDEEQKTVLHTSLWDSSALLTEKNLHIAPTFRWVQHSLFLLSFIFSFCHLSFCFSRKLSKRLNE